jgi:hypothetical protein
MNKKNLEIRNNSPKKGNLQQDNVELFNKVSFIFINKKMQCTKPIEIINPPYVFYPLLSMLYILYIL